MLKSEPALQDLEAVLDLSNRLAWASELLVADRARCSPSPFEREAVEASDASRWRRFKNEEDVMKSVPALKRTPANSEWTMDPHLRYCR